MVDGDCWRSAFWLRQRFSEIGFGLADPFRLRQEYPLHPLLRQRLYPVIPKRSRKLLSNRADYLSAPESRKTVFIRELLGRRFIEVFRDGRNNRLRCELETTFS